MAMISYKKACSEKDLKGVNCRFPYDSFPSLGKENVGNSLFLGFF